MQKNYYITDRDTWQRHSSTFKESHYVYLPLTAEEKARGEAEPLQVLVVAKFAHEGQEFHFRSHPKVESLPHMLSRRPLQQKHLDRLAFAGVTPNDSTFDAMEKVSEFYGAPLHHPIH